MSQIISNKTQNLERFLVKDQIPRSVSCCQMNERITEDIVRDILKDNQKEYPKVTIEEQKSSNPRIEKLLKNASKKGTGIGKPEFIITFDEIPRLILTIECKADVKKHESKNRDKYSDYAVDGVLLYSSYLSKEFDVIAVAVSGQSKSELKVSNFLQLKSQKVMNEPDKKILDFEEYVTIYQKNPEKEKKDLSDLLRYSKKLHDYLRDHAKLIESDKPLFVSAILLALKEPTFVSSYAEEKKPIDLATSIVKNDGCIIPVEFCGEGTTYQDGICVVHETVLAGSPESKEDWTDTPQLKIQPRFEHEPETLEQILEWCKTKDHKPFLDLYWQNETHYVSAPDCQWGVYSSENGITVDRILGPVDELK